MHSLHIESKVNSKLAFILNHAETTQRMCKVALLACKTLFFS